MEIAELQEIQVAIEQLCTIDRMCRDASLLPPEVVSYKQQLQEFETKVDEDIRSHHYAIIQVLKSQLEAVRGVKDSVDKVFDRNNKVTTDSMEGVPAIISSTSPAEMKPAQTFHCYSRFDFAWSS